MNITGNIILGQMSGDTAKQLPERFGKIMQESTGMSVNSSDTSICQSKQLDLAIPVSKISSLSSGEFAGLAAGEPNKKIELKTFHCSIINDHEALQKDQKEYKPIPIIAK